VDELELNGRMPATKIQDGFVSDYSSNPGVVPVANPDVLKDADVKFIRFHLHLGNHNVAELADMFKRSERTIRRIRDRESYKHVK
jgi:hypothetical protein